MPTLMFFAEAWPGISIKEIVQSPTSKNLINVFFILMTPFSWFSVSREIYYTNANVTMLLGVMFILSWQGFKIAFQNDSD